MFFICINIAAIKKNSYSMKKIFFTKSLLSISILGLFTLGSSKMMMVSHHQVVM